MSALPSSASAQRTPPLPRLPGSSTEPPPRLTAGSVRSPSRTGGHRVGTTTVSLDLGALLKLPPLSAELGGGSVLRSTIPPQLSSRLAAALSSRHRSAMASLRASASSPDGSALWTDGAAPVSRWRTALRASVRLTAGEAARLRPSQTVHLHLSPPVPLEKFRVRVRRPGRVQRVRTASANAREKLRTGRPSRIQSNKGITARRREKLKARRPGGAPGNVRARPSAREKSRSDALSTNNKTRSGTTDNSRPAEASKSKIPKPMAEKLSGYREGVSVPKTIRRPGKLVWPGAGSDDKRTAERTASESLTESLAVNGDRTTEIARPQSSNPVADFQLPLGYLPPDTEATEDESTNSIHSLVTAANSADLTEPETESFKPAAPIESASKPEVTVHASAVANRDYLPPETSDSISTQQEMTTTEAIVDKHLEPSTSTVAPVKEESPTSASDEDLLFREEMGVYEYLEPPPLVPPTGNSSQATEKSIMNEGIVSETKQKLAKYAENDIELETVTTLRKGSQTEKIATQKARKSRVRLSNILKQNLGTSSSSADVQLPDLSSGYLPPDSTLAPTATPSGTESTLGPGDGFGEGIHDS